MRKVSVLSESEEAHLKNNYGNNIPPEPRNSNGGVARESPNVHEQNIGKRGAAAGTQEDPSGPSESTMSKRPKRRKVDLACVYCRRSHMTCDEGRPCSRCIRRNIGHLCRDEPKKAHNDPTTPIDRLDHISSSSAPLAQIEPSPVSAHLSTAMVLTSQSNSGLPSSSVFQEISDPKQVPSLDLGQDPQGPQPMRENLNSSKADSYMSNALNPAYTDWTSLGNQSILAQTSEFGQNLFYSEHANSEFASLGDFLSMIEENSEISMDQPQPLRSYSGGENTMDSVFDRKEPKVSDSARDKFFLTAADPSVDVSPEERLKQVIQAKVEAGLLQPFNYARGYARLQKYIDNYMNQASKQRILKPLSVFRPAFRAIAQSLMDIDLVLVEETFERMLLDYDRVFTSMAIPACLWRRTGEIYRGNKEFAGLVEVNVDDLRDGKLVIYELMSEDSAVNYWEKYGNIAFDSGQKAVLTSCNLRTRDRRKRRACCFSFTIQRDRYNM